MDIMGVAQTVFDAGYLADSVKPKAPKPKYVILNKRS
jgi:hypothetical protein